MMAAMRSLRARSSLRSVACAFALPVVAACGGSGGSAAIQPPPPPPPVTSPIAPGASVATQGYSGGTLTFHFGSGVPAGETFTVGPLAKPPPAMCPPAIPTCLLPEQPVDAVAISVGSAALPLSAITSVGLSGFTLQAASFTLADTSVDEGTTTFSSTPSGGPLVETHAYPDEGAPIVALQPNRQYVLTLWGHASLDKPPGASFITPGGTVSAGTPSGDAITLVFGNTIPAKEWIIVSPAGQFNVTNPPGTFDAIAIEMGPTPRLPLSTIAGVILQTTRSFSGTRVEAGVSGLASESALSAALPLALAPPGSQPPNPAQLTFQTGPDYGTSLTQFGAQLTYVLSIRTY